MADLAAPYTTNTPVHDGGAVPGPGGVALHATYTVDFPGWSLGKVLARYGGTLAREVSVATLAEITTGDRQIIRCRAGTVLFGWTWYAEEEEGPAWFAILRPVDTVCGHRVGDLLHPLA